MKRPTAMRSAFESAGVYPQSSKRLVMRCANAVKSKVGFTEPVTRGKGYADGPRPKWAGPVTMFNKEQDHVI